MKKFLVILLIVITASCQNNRERQANVITSDIDNFWTAYDLIVKETDRIKQIQLIDSLYIRKGTIGLEKIMDARGYSAEEYVELINSYPNFFSSIRPNTLKSE
jgi:hypothetical protein